VYRGANVVVAHVADSPAAPRVQTLDFGLHEGAHATAFGKVMLAGMEPAQRAEYLKAHGLPGLTSQTVTDLARPEAHLESVGTTGIAWEFEELQPGLVCAATPVRSADGHVIGSVAVSGGVDLAQRAEAVDRALRQAAADVGRCLRRHVKGCSS
jgi:DNA-binding IclR family transcriptional regulator